MTPTELVDQIENSDGPETAQKTLSQYPGMAGISEAYFNRFVTYMGADPSSALKLAEYWKLVARFGDRPALAYRAKGGAERLRGEWARSIRSFERAAAFAEEPAEAFALQVGSVDSLARLGRVEEAVRLGKKLVRGLVSLGETEQAGRVRLNVAAALLWEDNYPGAKKWLKTALLELDSVEQAQEVALAKMSLSTCELLGGNPLRAQNLANEARDHFIESGQAHLANLCDSNIAQSLIQTGRPDRSLEVLLRLREAYAPDTLDAARVEEFLGDAFLKLNLPEEARNAYETALGMPAMRASIINRANCLLGLSWSSRQIGDLKEARRASSAAIRLYERFGNALWANVARLSEAECRLALGESDRSLDIAEAAAASLHRAKAKFALAEAHLIVGEARLALGRDCLPELRAARKLVQTRGMLGLEWRCHELMARAQPHRSLRHYRRMHEAILRSRTETTSLMAKASLLRDKTRALGRYLDFLLSRPSPSRVQEAFALIRSTRAVTLIDEALSADPTRFPAGLSESLRALREELFQETDEPMPGGSVRRTMYPRRERMASARKWRELTSLFQTQLAEGSALAPDPFVRVLALTESSAHVLHQGHANRLAIGGNLGEAIRMLQFEMMAPILDPECSDAPIEKMLEGWRDVMRPLWSNGEPHVRVAPDGEFWSLPWPALSPEGVEPILALAPGMGVMAGQARLPKRPKVVIWAGPHSELPQIEAEADAVEKAFPGATRICSARDIRKFLEIGSADLVHVACHAHFDANVPMFSYLEFPDGRIHAFEIAQSGFTCDLATLSACDTGSLSLLNRHEPEGLVRAFLARRAKAVLASLWMLDDGAARKFAQRYNLELSSGVEIGGALAAARKELRESMSHPYFWAPLVLFGGYRL